MKKTNIDSEEVLISQKIIELFNFEVINGYVCRNGIAIIIDGRIIKTIHEGENIIQNNESLFRPVKSSLLANYLLQELFYEDDDINIFLAEDGDLRAIKIYDSDYNLLAIGESKNLTESIILAIFKFYLGENSIYYTDKMNFCKF